MFNQLFTSPKAVDRYSNGPLLNERARYLAHCAAQGSTRSSLRLTAQHQLVVIDYLHVQDCDSITVEQIEAAADNRFARVLCLFRQMTVFRKPADSFSAD
jgi:hypothetical protein